MTVRCPLTCSASPAGGESSACGAALERIACSFIDRLQHYERYGRCVPSSSKHPALPIVDFASVKHTDVLLGEGGCSVVKLVVLGDAMLAALKIPDLAADLLKHITGEVSWQAIPSFSFRLAKERVNDGRRVAAPSCTAHSCRLHPVLSTGERG